MNNNIKIITARDPKVREHVTLTLLSQGFSERTVAYGPDGQSNRAALRFAMTYQLLDPEGKFMIPDATLQVERELTINPNAVLATENERIQLKHDLMMSAACQLVRQILTTLDNQL